MEWGVDVYIMQMKPSWEELQVLLKTQPNFEMNLKN